MRIVNNKYLEAFLKLLLFSAIVHFILLVVYSIKTKSLLPLNYFNILDLDLFFPSLIQEFWGVLTATVLMIAIYLYFLYKIAREKAQPKK